MHLDVDNLTSRGETASPYEISSLMFKLYAKMSEFFLSNKALSFFNEHQRFPNMQPKIPNLPPTGVGVLIGLGAL